MANTIVIFSTKGGVGKSLIASNVGVSLAKDLEKKVLIVDLDLTGIGDIARMLDTKPQRAIVDIMALMKKQIPSFKKEDFVVKTQFGVDLLCGVLKPQQSPHLVAGMIKDVIAMWDKEYDFIIVDAGKAFSDVLVATLNQANLILLITTPDIISIYQTKWALDTLQFLQ